jgi:AcrR family transcriptional regulator
MEIHEPVAERKEAPANERSIEILDAAVATFAAKGYAQTDVQEIADRVGVGKGTVYRHFGSKEALFLAAVKHARDKLIAAVDAVQNTQSDPLAQLRTCMTAILRFFDSNPEIVELLIEERALFRDRRPSLFFEHDENRRCEWAARLQSMIDAGTIRDIPVPEIQDTISRFVFGAMFFNYFEGNRRPLADESHAMFDVLFNGLLAKSPAAQSRD